MDERLVRAALGELPADLVIRNTSLVNVDTAEVERHVDVAVKDGRVAMVGDAGHCIGNKTKVVEAKGRYLTPGLLDAHLHVESSMLTLTEFARAVLPRGTTAVFIDPHEIANVLGLRGIRLLLGESKRLPLKVFVEIPPCVPSAPAFETTGAVLKSTNIITALGFEKVVGLGEVMNFPGVLGGDKNLHRVISAARGSKAVEGHAPGLLGKELAAYISAGVKSDHESTTGEEALERLRRGMKLELREGSVAKNLSALIKPILKLGLDTRHCLLATDDRQACDLLREGHVDHVLRRAIEEGVDPIAAIQMATINTAEHFGVQELGSLSPGKTADAVLVEDLRRFKVSRVFVNGKLMAERGKLLVNLPKFVYPNFARRTVRLRRRPTLDDFAVRVPRRAKWARVRLISAEGGRITTEHEVAELEVRNGVVLPDLERDVVRVAVVERHRGTGNVGLGFVRGFGLKEGALASSVGHDAHNLVVIGVGLEDMVHAINRVVALGGGLAAVSRGRMLATLELPIAGLMADKPAEEVCRKLRRLQAAASELGVGLKSPFMIMAFLPLAVIPKLRITDRGLVDIEKGELVDPIVEVVE
jgi:adenine deaminase